MSNYNTHEKAILEYLQKVIEAVAHHNLGRDEAVNDCVAIFLEQAYTMPEAQHWPISEEAAAVIAAGARRCAEAEARRLRRLRWREKDYLDVNRSETSSRNTTSAVQADVGPEYIAVVKCVLEQVALVVGQLPRSYGPVFRLLFIERNTRAECAQRTGRSRQAVDQRANRLIETIRVKLAELGLTGEEISNILNDIDRRFSPCVPRYSKPWSP